MRPVALADEDELYEHIGGRDNPDRQKGIAPAEKSRYSARQKRADRSSNAISDGDQTRAQAASLR
jgi:hypothetical protein